MTTDQQQPQAWYCSHQEHSTGECGPMCECTVRISNGTYGQPSDWRQQQPQAGEIDPSLLFEGLARIIHAGGCRCDPPGAGEEFCTGHCHLRATVARQAEQIERLREELTVYANRENWFHATHVPGHGWPTKVWAWDDAREPWSMAQKALATLEPGR